MLRIVLIMMILAGAGLTGCTTPGPSAAEPNCKDEGNACEASDGGGGSGGY